VRKRKAAKGETGDDEGNILNVKIKVIDSDYSFTIHTVESVIFMSVTKIITCVQRHLTS
jgi:hypothetical protein